MKFNQKSEWRLLSLIMDEFYEWFLCGNGSGTESIELCVYSARFLRVP